MSRYTENLPDLSQGYCVLDTETTGLSPNEDSIIELSVLVYTNGQATTRTSLIKAVAEVPANITEITGITSAMINADGKPPAEIYTSFLAMPELRELPIAGHNIMAFDRLFLLYNIRKHLGDAAYYQASEILGQDRLVDTGALFKGIALGHPPRPSETHFDWVGRIRETRRRGLQWNLRVAAQKMGVQEPPGEAHRARYDVMLCHLLLQKILES